MAPKKKRKRKRKSPLNDLVRFQVKALAKFGFSYRYIASMVFHKPTNRVTASEIASVQGFCYRNGLKVSDWRNGITPVSRQYATRGMKPPKKRKKPRVSRKQQQTVKRRRLRVAA